LSHALVKQADKLISSQSEIISRPATCHVTFHSRNCKPSLQTGRPRALPAYLHSWQPQIKLKLLYAFGQQFFIF